MLNESEILFCSTNRWKLDEIGVWSKTAGKPYSTYWSWDNYGSLSTNKLLGRGLLQGLAWGRAWWSHKRSATETSQKCLKTHSLLPQSGWHFWYIFWNIIFHHIPINKLNQTSLCWDGSTWFNNPLVPTSCSPPSTMRRAPYLQSKMSPQVTGASAPRSIAITSKCNLPSLFTLRILHHKKQGPLNPSHFPNWHVLLSSDLAFQPHQALRSDRSASKTTNGQVPRPSSPANLSYLALEPICFTLDSDPEKRTFRVLQFLGAKKKTAAGVADMWDQISSHLGKVVSCRKCTLCAQQSETATVSCK